MANEKNKVSVLIEDCRHCSNATLKFDRMSEEDIMYCQTESSITMLRERWGNCPIPKWCPRLGRRVSICGRHIQIPGILS